MFLSLISSQLTSFYELGALRAIGRGLGEVDRALRGDPICRGSDQSGRTRSDEMRRGKLK